MDKQSQQACTIMKQKSPKGPVNSGYHLLRLFSSSVNKDFERKFSCTVLENYIFTSYIDVHNENRTYF